MPAGPFASFRPGRLALGVAVLLGGALGPSHAHAQGAENAAAAEAQFQEGRKLMEAKRYGEACPKFLASYKLGPAAGTLLNLADCYEKNGQIASAWTRFHEAIALAQRANRPDREKVARERADKLEPRLSWIVVRSASSDVAVKLDGAAVDPSSLGDAMAIDPGKHTIEGTAPGKVPFKATIEVDAHPKSTTVEVPALEDEKATALPKPEDKARETPGSSGSTQRTLGIVAFAAGGVGVIAGTYFGFRTSSKWSDAQTRCTSQGSGLECDSAGVDLAQEARRSGDVSTVAFIVGGVLLAGGAALYLTAPSARGPQVRAGIGPGSVVVGGRF